MIGQFDPPRVQGNDPVTQAQYLTSYIRQLVDELNFTFNDLQNEIKDIKDKLDRKESEDGNV